MNASATITPGTMPKRPRSPARPLSVFVVLLAFGIVTVITLAPQTDDGQSLIPFWYLVAAVCLTCLVPTLIDSCRREFELITARNVFILYVLLQFVASPVIVSLGGYTVSGGVRITFLSSGFQSALKGQICVAAGILLFQLTYYLNKRRLEKRPCRRITSTVSIDPNKMGIFAIALTAVGLFSLWYLARGEGGLSTFLTN